MRLSNGKGLPLSYFENIVGSRFIATGHAVAHLVEAPRYNPEVPGFDSQWGHWHFLFT
jgi:hypothetical protein